MPNSNSKPCEFCQQTLIQDHEGHWIRCSNKKCRSHIFVVGNKVLHRYYQEFGIGEIQECLPFEDQSNPVDPSFKQKKANKLLDQQQSNQEKASITEFGKYIVDFAFYYNKYLYADELSHFIFENGQKIRFYAESTEQKSVGQITNRNLSHKSGLIYYEVEGEDGILINIPENQIIDQINSPLEEFFKGKIDTPSQFLLRIWGRQFENLYASNSIKFVTNARLSLMPHQVAVAHRLLTEGTPRCILADEVGLGKTIEAGIFIKEMLARKVAERILIIAPASILGQWEFEMENKFNLKFDRITSALIKRLTLNYRTGNYQNIDTGKDITLYTVSLQFARLSQCASFLTHIEWDIVIFDEAHHLRRYLSNQKTEQYHTTLAYQLAQELSQKTQSLLLLTATPIQLHSFDLFSLIELCNPFEFPTYESFEFARQNLSLLNMVIRNLYNFTRLNSFERKALVEQIMAFGINLSQEEIDKKVAFQPNRLEFARLLEEKHFLSKYVIRNRRRIVFPNRKIRRIPQMVEVTLTQPELDIYNRIHLYLARIYSQSFENGMTGMGFVMVILQKLLTSSVPAILDSLRKRINYLKENQDTLLRLGDQNELAREFTDDEATQDLTWGFEDFDLEDRVIIQKRKQTTEKKAQKPMLDIKDHIKVLEEFTDSLLQLKSDSKADALIKILREIFQKNPNEKILIFTQFKKTLSYLAELIRAEGFTVAEFHGDLDEERKNQAIVNFRHEISILLSTEIGGEGRNFQFCHIIVNYDLPWNPMRLEQRIGRLDRIGQTQDVLIYNFFIKETVESSIILAIDERIHLFEESIGALEPILGSLEGKITSLILEKDETPLKFRLDEVIQKANNDIETVEARLEDMLLDKRSFQYDQISKDLMGGDQLSEIDLNTFLTQFENLTQNPLTRTLFSPPIELRMQPWTIPNEVGLWRIEINENLKHRLLQDKNTYIGVFDLDLAQKQEEADFFALGHPLLMSLFSLTGLDSFGGFNTILTINYVEYSKLFQSPYKNQMKVTESDVLERSKAGEIGLNLFLFQIDFLGLSRESNLIPIIISDDGILLPELTNFVVRPHNLHSIISNSSDTTLTDKKPIIKCTKEQLLKIYDIALQSTKNWVKNRAESLVNLNKQRFEQEKFKVLKMADYKQHYADAQIKNLNEKLRAKRLKLPTERQLQNLEQLTDTKKRKLREQEFEKQKQDVLYYENQIQRWSQLLEKIEFDTPERLKRLKKYRKMEIRADLYAFAKIVLI